MEGVTLLTFLLGTFIESTTDDGSVAFSTSAWVCDAEEGASGTEKGGFGEFGP